MSADLEAAWSTQALQAEWSRRWPGFEVAVVEATASTNSDLLDQARQGKLHPRVRVARDQTAGRGRQGRSWQSSPGASLTFSIGLCLRPAHGWGALSLVVGSAVADVLQPEGFPTAGRLMLKWPNDLWWYDHEPRTPAQRAAGQKVGGILIETLPLPETDPALSGQRWVVIGIGLNVRDVVLEQDEPGSPSFAQAPASISRWWPQASAPMLWRQLVPAVLRAVEVFSREGLEPFMSAVLDRELLVGQPVSLTAGTVREGICIGIDRDGALRVQTSQGEQRVVAGEVSVRPRLGD